MTGSAVVRRMRWWDVDDAACLEAVVFPADPWSPATFWSELAGVPATRHYVAAEADGELVGYAGLMVVGTDGDVQTLAVAPAHRGRGLGRRLLEDLLAEAARRGCTQVLLEVRHDNAEALALYTSLGFERLAVRRGYYGPGEDAAVMRLRPVVGAGRR